MQCMKSWLIRVQIIARNVSLSAIAKYLQPYVEGTNVFSTKGFEAWARFRSGRKGEKITESPFSLPSPPPALLAVFRRFIRFFAFPPPYGP